MNRPDRVTVSHVLWALLGFLYLGIAPDAQAATITDTFELGLTGKEWCRNDPKFFETFKNKIAHGDTLTVTREVPDNGGVTNILANIKTKNGENATVDAITMNGLAFPRNKSGMKAELALSGTDPGNTDHFITVRGQAKFDKAGNLTKVTGKFVFQVPVMVNQLPVECFGDGTFGTGNRLEP